MDADILHEIGEWAALGFYEGLSLPWPRAFGLALRRLYEHMPVRVHEDRLLVPFEPLAGSWTMASHGQWSAQGLILNLNHNSGLHVSEPMLAEKKRRFPQHGGFIDALAADLRPRLPHFGGYTHSNPDIRRVVDEGFLAMDAELERELAAVRAAADDSEALHLLLALQDYSAGVKAHHRRVLAALTAAVAAAGGRRRDELAAVRNAFADCFLVPSTTFLQGLLAVNLTWMLDGCDSIGRFDQALGGLFERDLASGELDPVLARRLLDEVWQAFERLNGWNLQIGGRRADGTDGGNALTRECILACGRNRLRRPNVALRISRDTPDGLLGEALEVLGQGSGRPALYNDDLYIETLLGLDLGLTPADAAEIGFGGCTETMIAGLSNCGSLEGTIHLAKALELALFNGVDPGSGRQTGPATGAFTGFADFAGFQAAVREQIRAQTARFVETANAALRRRFREGDPKLYRTLFTRDCVRNHRSFEAGGARYNWSVVSYQGIGNLIDGLAAVRHCVYDRGVIRPEQLVEALRADFAGPAAAVQAELKAAPKFGNDDPGVDDLGAAIMDFAWRDLLSHRQARGGRFLPSCIVFATYAQAGESVGATPDGRHARAPLNDSVGAVAGCDRRGPTALLNSVAKLPLALAVGTPVLNVRLQPTTLASTAGRAAGVSLVRTFFAKGGMQIQITAVDRNALLAAQANPDLHRDLIVRIGGYSEYFTRLGKALQDTVIARTEHGL